MHLTHTLWKGRLSVAMYASAGNTDREQAGHIGDGLGAVQGMFVRTVNFCLDKLQRVLFQLKIQFGLWRATEDYVIL